MTAGAGFLLAVLWFDLMFDVQAFGHRGELLPEEVLSSIAAYYRRVTTAARPMNRLIALAMLATLAAIAVELARASPNGWVPAVSLALALGPTALAAARIVPRAVRLGAREDPIARQSALARSILREHLYCAASIAALIALQLIYS